MLVTHEPDIAQFAKRGIQFRDGTIRRDELVQNRPIAAEVLRTFRSWRIDGPICLPE